MSIIDPLLEKYSKIERVQNAVQKRYPQDGEKPVEEYTLEILKQITTEPERIVEQLVEEKEKSEIIDDISAQKEAEAKQALIDYENSKHPIDEIK